MGSFIAQFKKVSDKTSSRFGQKRESFAVEFPDIVVSEIPESQIVKIIEDSLVSYGKRLIAENGSDWNYCPSMDDLTVANLYADLCKPDSRGSRAFTVANIAAFATVYKTIMVQECGKTDSQAKAGYDLLVAKLTPILAKEKLIAGMENNILAVASTQAWEVAVANNPVIEAVMAKFIDIIEETRAPVSEELDEDSI